MNPIESITTCFQKYVTFSGRASRSEFWYFYLACFLVLIIGEEISQYAYLLFFAMVIPYLSVAVRRMHDGNHSGWWLFVPIVNLVFLVSRGTVGPNKYGDIAIEQL